MQSMVVVITQHLQLMLLLHQEKLNVNGGWLQVVGVTILLDALLNPSGSWEALKKGWEDGRK